MAKAKRCGLCGGVPKFVYYNIPRGCGSDDSFDLNEDGELEPMILIKRLECSKCGATTGGMSFFVDDAIRMWNEEGDGHRCLLQKHGEEMCSDVEEVQE